MSDACEYLHQAIRNLPRFRAGFSAAAVPRNGIYFLFETDEHAHNGERIVRIGTHTGDGNLPKRLMEHLCAKNKDRSVFRKHIGRCLLKRDNNAYAERWEYDLTKKQDRAKYGSLIDWDIQNAIEDDVTDYMTNHLSFAVFQINEKANRLFHEERLISTLSKCTLCKASPNWLGGHHPNPLIASTGLWNIQGHKGEVFSRTEIKGMLAAE